MPEPRWVVKRDGSEVPFDRERIKNAVYRAMLSSRLGSMSDAEEVTRRVLGLLQSDKVDVETIQDRVEEVLMEYERDGVRFAQVARAYILYREQRRLVRETKRNLGVNDDMKLTLNAVEVLRARYLLKDRNGNVVETPRQMFWRVALNVGMVELVYEFLRGGNTREGKFYQLSPTQISELKRIFEKVCSEKGLKCDWESFREFVERPSMAWTYIEQFYREMTELRFLPNSPTLMNAGTELGQLSACFVLPVGDSIDEIFETLKNTARIHKSGGGTGFSFSRLRPKNDVVGSTMGVASGPVSFMKVFDVTTDVIKQGGKRRGANMGVLRYDHPDIMEFVTSKDPANTVLRNFNISVAVDEKFFEALSNDGYIDLVNPRTGQATGHLRAQTLWDAIVRSAWASGDPGLIFIDEINRHNTVPNLGSIEATNPCVAGDTFIFTSSGIMRARDLARKGGRIKVSIDSRFRKGQQRQASRVFTTGVKNTYRLITEEGLYIRLTLDHRVYSDDRGWVTAGELRRGERIRIYSGAGSFGSQGTREDGARIYRSMRGLDGGAQALVHVSLIEELLQMSREAQEGFISSMFAEGDNGEQLSVDVSDMDEEAINALHVLLINNGFQASLYGDKLNVRRQGEGGVSYTFAGLEFEGEEEVFDITEPVTHSFIANGLVVHNCGEQPLLDYESCNLGSINLSKFVVDGKIDFDALEKTVRLAVRFLDDVIDANRYPVKEIEEVTRKTRRIGLGVMGFADALALMDIPYDSNEALSVAEQVMSFIQETSHSESERLAEERGTFPAWEGSLWHAMGRKMRNSATTSIAPTGTISIIAGCSSSIEPFYALAFIRHVLDGKELMEVNWVLERKLRERGLYSEQLVNRIASTGTLVGTSVPEDLKRVFRTALEIRPEWHVTMQATFQKYVDAAVSKTINLPSDATVEDVEEAYRLARQLNCKGITVYRDRSKSEQVLYAGREQKPKAEFIVEVPEKYVEVDATFDPACPTGKCDVL